MRYTITKEFRFEASHRLPLMPDGHKCKRLHGHSYRVVVELAADDLDEFGFVEDYGELNDIRAYIDGELDHQYLNERFGDYEGTTAESIAAHLFGRFSIAHPALQAVTICETPSVSATYRP
jgi:6-pyruvoyltetrahydropterin/6-carboxytetrahydropterin synthase